MGEDGYLFLIRASTNRPPAALYGLHNARQNFSDGGGEIVLVKFSPPLVIVLVETGVQLARSGEDWTT